MGVWGVPGGVRAFVAAVATSIDLALFALQSSATTQPNSVSSADSSTATQWGMCMFPIMALKSQPTVTAAETTATATTMEQ